MHLDAKAVSSMINLLCKSYICASSGCANRLRDIGATQRHSVWIVMRLLCAPQLASTS